MDINIFDSVNAVSYTHLDVYKRQAQSSRLFCRQSHSAQSKENDSALRLELKYTLKSRRLFRLCWYRSLRKGDMDRRAVRLAFRLPVRQQLQCEKRFRVKTRRLL